MLTVKSVHTYYGNIHALKGVSLHVRTGEIVTLVGANGAGKSTLVNTICGMAKPSRGDMEFNGRPITGLPPESIVRKGIAMAPEGRQIFSAMSVEANLLMGGFIHRNNPEQLRRTWIASIIGSRFKEPAPSVGRNPERRRTANARHQPGANVPAAASGPG